MRKVMRPRFYCEHCNKGGGSGGHIKKHESRCTKNPDRECGMCKMLEHEQPDLQKLLAILPTADEQRWTDYSDDGRHSWEQWRDVPLETMKALRDAAGNCPACIMAALRQRGLPVATAEGFSFTKECQAIWAEINARQWDEECRAHYAGF